MPKKLLAILKDKHGLPRGVTLFGVCIAFFGLLASPENIPFFQNLFEERVAEKIMSLGVLLSSFGRAIQDSSKPGDDAGSES